MNWISEFYATLAGRSLRVVCEGVRRHELITGCRNHLQRLHDLDHGGVAGLRSEAAGEAAEETEVVWLLRCEDVREEREGYYGREMSLFLAS
jgi:hypothetical protein